MRSSVQKILWVALVILFTCSSCRQEICYDHYPAVDLNFSWELEWERDYGRNHFENWDAAIHRYEYEELRPSVPEWVKMVKYYDERMEEQFFSPDGKVFEVPREDNCSILFYNSDTEYIILSDVASLNDARATATTRSRAGSGLREMKDLYRSSRTTNPPDVIYAAYLQENLGAQVHEVKPVSVKMQPLVFTYLISYEFESGIENITLARGALGGMAEGVYLRTGVTTDDTSIILFDCDIHSDACRCQVRSFGIPSFPDSYFGRSGSSDIGPFTLNLEVKLKNGKTQEFNFDVTDQIKNQPRGGVIRVGGIKVENVVEPSSSSGFQVDVSGWDDDVKEIDLPIEPDK